MWFIVSKNPHLVPPLDKDNPAECGGKCPRARGGGERPRE